MRLYASREAQFTIALFLVFGLAIGPAIAGTTGAMDPVQPDGPGWLATAASGSATPLDALIVLNDEPDPSHLETIRSHDLHILHVFPVARTVHVEGTGAQLATASQEDVVAGVFENEALDLHLDTSTRVINARDVWDEMSGAGDPVSADGQIVEGAGVGIAIIDSGIDGTHPDLAPAVGSNQRWLCSTPVLIETASGHDKCYGNWMAESVVSGDEDLSCQDGAWTEMPNTDVDSGHGTHVASIAAGRGQASDGRHTGVAPGATLYGLGVGHGASILVHEAVAALEWVACMHDQVSPAIRVVNNSWGTGGEAFDPAHPVNIAVDALVAEGVTVVFAAGNAGAGATNTVSTFARNPTPGVLGVANYDDLDIASTEGVIAPGSSRCLANSEARECPDVAAPGTGVRAAQATTGPVTLAFGHPLSDNGRFTCCVVDPGNLAYAPWYAGVSGTSMAAPHVAGTVALLIQANPDLSPADVEDVLEDTAHRFASASYTITDPDNPTTTVSPTAGHGLVDVVAALEDTRVLDEAALGIGIPDLGTQPRVYVETPAGPVDGQFVSDVQWTVPTGQEVTLSERTIVSGDPISAPLSLSVSCRFLIDDATAVPCDGGTLVGDGDPDAFRMDASGYAFPSPGEHRVEAQLDLGAGFVGVDAFTVRALG